MKSVISRIDIYVCAIIAQVYVCLKLPQWGHLVIFLGAAAALGAAAFLAGAAFFAAGFLAGAAFLAAGFAVTFFFAGMIASFIFSYRPGGFCKRYAVFPRCIAETHPGSRG